MTDSPPNSKTTRARGLRRDHTDAERRFWSLVRNRQLAGFKFRRQTPIDRYFADFACAEARLVVELDGGQHADQSTYDDERTRVIEACGWRVVRFWNHQVLLETESVVETVLAELKLARP